MQQNNIDMGTGGIEPPQSLWTQPLKLLDFPISYAPAEYEWNGRSNTYHGEVLSLFSSI